MTLASLTTLALAGCETRTASDPVADAPSPAPAPPETLALPELPAQATPESFGALFAPTAERHQYRAAADGGVDGWEWHETLGRDGHAEFLQGRLVSAYLRRPRAAMPDLDAHVLPSLHIDMREDELTRAAGAGWPIERSLVAIDASVPPKRTVTLAWRITDHGRDTGAVLLAVIADGVVVRLEHPWMKS